MRHSVLLFSLVSYSTRLVRVTQHVFIQWSDTGQCKFFLGLGKNPKNPSLFPTLFPYNFVSKITQCYFFCTQIFQFKLPKVFKNLEIIRFCAKPRVHRRFHIQFILFQYDLFYRNVLNNNSRSHMKSLTAHFCQHRDRLS